MYKITINQLNIMFYLKQLFYSSECPPQSLIKTRPSLPLHFSCQKLSVTLTFRYYVELSSLFPNPILPWMANIAYFFRKFYFLRQFPLSI